MSDNFPPNFFCIMSGVLKALCKESRILKLGLKYFSISDTAQPSQRLIMAMKTTVPTLAVCPLSLERRRIVVAGIQLSGLTSHRIVMAGIQLSGHTSQ